MAAHLLAFAFLGALFWGAVVVLGEVGGLLVVALIVWRLWVVYLQDQKVETGEPGPH